MRFRMNRAVPGSEQVRRAATLDVPGIRGRREAGR
jgi:hypothetical protein